MVKTTKHRYQCKHCGKILVRDASVHKGKAWIKSYCKRTDMSVHLVRL